MTAKGAGVLLLLGAIWGASFMFIKVGGEEMQPFFLVEMRLSLAAIVLALVCLTKPGIFALMRANWRTMLVMGLLNCALPYTLITWGETHISSGMASIFNALTPLWVGALGFVWIWAERLSAGRLLGLLMGLAGVGLVVSGNFEHQGEADPTLFLLGQGAVILGALSYAIAGIYGRRKLQGLPVLVGAAGQLITGAIMILPFALFEVPDKVPSIQAIGSVVTLSILGTAIAALLFFWLLSNVGTIGTLLVTYLLPPFALVWGALFLHESATVWAILGLVLILLGITFTSGKAGALVAWRPGRAAARG
ncbi:MAG TPA: DMT family transporter [Chloroflexia bacterium]|nr:DMT family transporter [Chloroflexia bacterium]